MRVENVVKVETKDKRGLKQREAQDAKRLLACC